ncbi:DUF2970 domain-containing protein [Thaumasiovibrio subtropicus]|nr:DUF2970 domain-containing protein [Thaumasiovibrio subtropicus]
MSVLSALFGVQSEEHRERDFKQRSPLPYLLIGIAMIAFFVLGLVMIVKQVVGG